MLYLAQNEEQARSLDEYRRWGVSHGMKEDELLVLAGDEISKIEDGVTGDAALFSRSEGSVSYARLLEGLAGLANEQGCRFVYGCRAKIIKRAGRTHVACGEHELETDLLINSAGGSSLEILKQAGRGEDLTELYAGGVYYRLSSRVIKEHNVYLVPSDPKFPFTDPHIVLKPEGTNVLGPRPMLVSGPYNYEDGVLELVKAALKYITKSWFEGYEILGDRSLRKALAENWRSLFGTGEMIRKMSRYVRNLSASLIDGEEFRGLRHMLIHKKEGLISEPWVWIAENEVHVLNFDGPGATGAPAFAMMLLNQLVSDGFVEAKDHADVKLWKGLAEMRLTLESFTGRGIRITRA